MGSGEFTLELEVPWVGPVAVVLALLLPATTNAFSPSCRLVWEENRRGGWFWVQPVIIGSGPQGWLVDGGPCWMAGWFGVWFMIWLLLACGQDVVLCIEL